jgi:hypothetical protein
MSEVPKVPEKCLLDEKGRQTSVDSEAFFDYDDYDDDFIPNNAKGGGGGGSNKKKSGGGGVYTSKHIRAKESIRQKTKSSQKK